MSPFIMMNLNARGLQSWPNMQAILIDCQDTTVLCLQEMGWDGSFLDQVRNIRTGDVLFCTAC